MRTTSWPEELSWISLEMRPIAELCSGEQAHLFTRALTLCHFDVVIGRNGEARRLLDGNGTCRPRRRDDRAQAVALTWRTKRPKLGPQQRAGCPDFAKRSLRYESAIVFRRRAIRKLFRAQGFGWIYTHDTQGRDIAGHNCGRDQAEGHCGVGQRVERVYAEEQRSEQARQCGCAG